MGGEAIVRACAETGTHYADTSDEFYWQRWMIDRHHGAAQKSGAKVVLSAGFCVFAGDVGSQLAIKSLGASAGADLHLDAWLETYNGGLSAGVINTGKAIKNASFPKEWNTDPYVLAPSADPALRVDSVVTGMSYPKLIRGEGLVVSNIFGPYDARLLRRSFTQLGQKVQLRVGATSGLYPKWTAFIAKHPGSWASRFKASAEGPSKTVLLSGSGDPGYRFTSW